MIKTWKERCAIHPDHQTGMVTYAMIQERMQEEIDDHRAAVRELVEALQTCAELVQWMSSAYEGNEEWEAECDAAVALARAAIAKHQEGKE